MEILKYKSDLENIYYYGKKSQSEIDFILQNEFSGKIFPIEVKTGSKDNIPIIFKSFLEDYREKIGNFYLINNDICKMREV
jgi:predicted AAA+ superfamily ATPase